MEVIHELTMTIILIYWYTYGTEICMDDMQSVCKRHIFEATDYTEIRDSSGAVSRKLTNSICKSQKWDTIIFEHDGITDLGYVWS